MRTRTKGWASRTTSTSSGENYTESASLSFRPTACFLSYRAATLHFLQDIWARCSGRKKSSRGKLSGRAPGADRSISLKHHAVGDPANPFLALLDNSTGPRPALFHLASRVARQSAAVEATTVHPLCFDHILFSGSRPGQQKKMRGARLTHEIIRLLVLFGARGKGVLLGIPRLPLPD